MKQCNQCNETKSLDDFYSRLSKNKIVKYGHCKKCHSKKVIKTRKLTISNVCFRCNKNFLQRKIAKYCSIKCKSEGISERKKFERELGLISHKRYTGFTY